VVYDRTGQELGRYDKRRLFGFERRRNVQPGERALVVPLDGIPCGVLICADLWFPEQVRELAATADLLCVPAQTTIRAESQPAYARMLWQTLAMTRAQENVLAVAVCDQAASSRAPFRCGGVASITDPSAEADPAAIQRTLEDGGAGYLIATIDVPRLRRFRAYRRENGLLPPIA
jgi:predicted amidohydrolase